MFFSILILKNKSTTPKNSGAQNFSSTPQASITNKVDISNFSVSWFEINNIENLKLIPNFSQKVSSREILDKYNCKFLSNGPFYSKEAQPLGLFISDGKTLGQWQQNQLFDGILSINDILTPRITRSVPSDNLRIAIQSGPVLKENNSFQTLQIKDDSGSRRVFAAITGSNKLYLLIVYDPLSQYSGPLLTDLPTILKSFEEKTGIVFADAINLDGGAASTFNTLNLNLSELNPVGAFFCQL